MKTVNCNIHGRQEVGVACVHVLHAIDDKTPVGFFTYDYQDCARPWAWCKSCEGKLVAVGDGPKAQWMAEAQFKVVCCLCWDQASAVAKVGQNS